VILTTLIQNGQGVPLGSDESFAVLAASTVTNAGPTLISGNLGVSPGTAVTGFGAGTGTVSNGAIHAADAVAAQAQLDLSTAYTNAAGRTNPVAVPADIGGMVITPGLYAAPVSLAITGNLTLDDQNNPNSVFIFQAASTLVTAVGSSVTLINGANACNVFWQVGSSATLNTSSVFSGAVLAQASISLGVGATVNGRLLARAGAVTLLSDAISNPGP
jgi:Ice-binding-like